VHDLIIGSIVFTQESDPGREEEADQSLNSIQIMSQADLEYCSRMKKTSTIVIMTLGLLVSNASAIGQTNTLPNMDSGWLVNLNYYRVAAGLKPITEDKNLSASVKKHMIYLVKSDPKYFVGAYINRHSENPASPYYTLAGAGSGNELTSNTSANEAGAIDSWMQAPFHAVGLLREGLKSVGFDTEFNATTGLYEFGMDIFGNLKSQRTKIVIYPGKGSLSRMDHFQGESPDSREACGSNWKNYGGLPLWVSLLTSPPSQMTAQLITPSGKVLKSGGDICIVNEKNFITSDRVNRAAGKAIITGGHLVLIIPKRSLAPGMQKASLSMKGRPAITWSFTVIGPPPAITWSATATTITWDKPVAQLQNPISGYEVMFSDLTLKIFQSFRTTTTSFETVNLVPGQYFVCVRAIGRYRSGTCSVFSSFRVKNVL
jgi:hypothetical protein